MKNLLIGCGHARDKRLEPDRTGRPERPTWLGDLETLDYESPCNPDWVWDLEHTPWPLPESAYDEVHAYEVLEHLGQQGDYVAFFATFTEIWRILKPNGFLCATTPGFGSRWVWGDPGHRRVVFQENLIFLTQRAYDEQRGVTTMTDYRRVYRADFEVQHSVDNGKTHAFILQAIKPSRCP